MNTKDYLGDSVYAEWDGNRIILTTENGLGPSNVIYLEPEVIVAFERYLARLKASIEAQNPVPNPVPGTNPTL